MNAQEVTYLPEDTALLIIDPYNDFLSEGGKLWPQVREVAEEIGLLDHMRAVLSAAREQGFHVFIVPHHQTAPGDYETWDHLSPTQQHVLERQTFAAGSWGGPNGTRTSCLRRTSWSCGSTGHRVASPTRTWT